MSYKPHGASLPSRFKKSNEASSFRQYPRDRLIVVEGYDLANNTMVATDVRDGRKMELRINPEKAALPTRISTKYNGNTIDERMAEFIAVGHRCRAWATKVDKKVKRGNDEVSMVTANWVRSLPSQDPKKAFVGWFSVSSYDGRITGAQHVPEEMRVAIRPSDPEGEQKLNELGEKLNQIAQAYAQGKHPITLGVCFRTLVKTGEREKDGKTVPVYQMIDSTPPFDWEAAELDGDRNVIKEGSPVTQKFMEDNLEGYLDYVYGSEDQSKPDAFPGLRASGVLKEGQVPVVEIEVYRSLAASRLSESLDISNERSPLYSLANVMTKYSLTDPHGYVGKNWMVEGIIVLTEDKKPETRDGEWIERNLVTDLMINGPRVNFHSIYHAADGGIVEIHPSLDRVIEQRADRANTNTNANAGAGAGSAASEPAPSLTAVSAALEDSDVEENFFAVSTQAALDADKGDATDPGATQEAPSDETPAVADPPADTPSEAPATPGRFTRRT